MYTQKTVEEWTQSRIEKVLDHDENARNIDSVINRYAVAQKKSSLLDRGQQTPIMYNNRSKKILRGHLRSQAYLEMSKEEVKAFGKIAVETVDVDDYEEQVLRADHADTTQLQPSEIFRQVAKWLDASIGHNEIVYGLYDLYAPLLKSAKRSQNEKLRIEGKLTKKDIFSAGNGKIQRWTAVYKLPESAQVLYMEGMDGVGKSIGDKDVKALTEANKLGNKLCPTKEYGVALETIKNRQGKTKSTLGLSKGDVLKKAESCNSAIMKGILLATAREKGADVTNLILGDEILYKLEIISQDKSEYQNVLDTINNAFEVVKIASSK